MSTPSSTTRPPLGVSRPASKPSSVDLPEPEAPTMASVSALCTVKSTLCRMVSSPLASATRLLRPATSIAAGMARSATAGAVAGDVAGASGTNGIEDAWGKSGMLILLSKKLKSKLIMLTAVLLSTAAASAYSAPKTILVVGDSLSAEYGLTRGAGWVALMAPRLKQYRIVADVVNASVSGETTSGGRTRLPALLNKYHPALVVIELGANDGLRGLPVAAAQANLRAMTTAAKDADAKVVLVGMRMPPNYGHDYTDKFFAMYSTVSKEFKAPLVPFMLEGLADKPQLFQGDQLHPIAAAHPAILANIWPTVEKTLKAR